MNTPMGAATDVRMAARTGSRASLLAALLEHGVLEVDEHRRHWRSHKHLQTLRSDRQTTDFHDCASARAANADTRAIHQLPQQPRGQDLFGSGIRSRALQKIRNTAGVPLFSMTFTVLLVRPWILRIHEPRVLADVHIVATGKRHEEINGKARRDTHVLVITPG